MFLNYNEKDLLKELIKIPSLSDKEDGIMKFLKQCFDKSGWVNFEITVNDRVAALLVVFGIPKVLYTSHVDVVDGAEKLFIPHEQDNSIYGRGACDAKGSVASMILACSELQKQGKTNFGLMLYAGQEKGAPHLSQCMNYLQGFGVEHVIMGEPTTNKLAVSQLGAICLSLKFYGEACLSAFSGGGIDANKYMVSAAHKLYSLDEHLLSMSGIWSVNLGRLFGGLSPNTLSPYAAIEVYIRTTQNNHEEIVSLVQSLAPEAKVEVLFSAQKLELEVLEGFKKMDVMVCSSLPYFVPLGAKLMMLGPGDPKLAHTTDEYVRESELVEATALYVSLYEEINIKVLKTSSTLLIAQNKPSMWCGS